jgi:hypothetical protein
MNKSNVSFNIVSGDEKMSGTDAYLLEHSGLVKAAQRIIQRKVEKNKFVTRAEVATAILRLPTVKGALESNSGFITFDKLRGIISMAARRGAFPGYKLCRRWGFMAATSDNQKLHEAKLHADVIKATTALFNFLGMNVTFTPKRNNKETSTVIPMALVPKSHRPARLAA